jgi:tetratricopeptide (TPR) repeat protein
MGDVFVHTRDYAEAFESYTNAIHFLTTRIRDAEGQPDPHGQVAGWAEEIREVFRRCDTMLAEGRFDEGDRARMGQLFVSLTNLAPFEHDGTMFYLLGNYLYETGRLEEAYRILRRGLDLGSPRQALIYRLVGVIRWEQYETGKMPPGREDEYLEEAYHNLKRAVFLDPELEGKRQTQTRIEKVEAERKRRGQKK